MKQSYIFHILRIIVLINESRQITAKKSIILKQAGNGIEIDFWKPNGELALAGMLGVSVPRSVGVATQCSVPEADDCFQYGDFAQVLYKELDSNCTRIEWSSTHARLIEDCYDIDSGVHWYGGNHDWYQTYPMDNHGYSEKPSVAVEFGCPSENYWVLSSGVTIHVDEDIPLFTSLNVETGKFCLISKDVHPYHVRNELTLNYEVCIGENIKDVHVRSMDKYYEKPSGKPDENMMLRPFWSTWAQYKTAVNQSIVIDMARRVVSEGFVLNSHIEIDDNWENCYGEAEFNSDKFPDPAAMVEELRQMNLRVTLWIHPFVNINCPSFVTGLENGYFVKDQKSKTGLTSWWTSGSDAGVIDFSNPDAANWWKSRLELLRTKYGIDSFKFDAGETNLIPHSIKQDADDSLHPNHFTRSYVESVSSFGGMIEVRTGRRNQNLPIFTRMFDKDSRFSYENGLQSMIPTLLHFGTLGYPFVLPDMIGGNAYGDKPTGELYVRWMQANAFMPAVQFSIVPWDYEPEVVEITKNILEIRERHKNLIVNAADEAVRTGRPINCPLWWIDPEDPETYTIDSQYMLGEDIMVAPVVEEGATTRNIYLPKGTWRTEEGATFEGPIWLNDYPAPLEVLPYFFKV